MFPAVELMAHLVRQSGKSVLTSTSITPQAWAANFPTCVRPIASRTPLRAPSEPTTYLARTVRSSPARSPATYFTRTSTGYSPAL